MARDNMEQNSFGNYSGPQIGVSVKSLQEISNLTPGFLKILKIKKNFIFQAVSQDVGSMMKTMAENLFNYAMSFTSDSKSIPISTIEMWFRNTQAKLSKDPNYFKKWLNWHFTFKRKHCFYHNVLFSRYVLKIKRKHLC